MMTENPENRLEASNLVPVVWMCPASGVTRVTTPLLDITGPERARWLQQDIGLYHDTQDGKQHSCELVLDLDHPHVVAKLEEIVERKLRENAPKRRGPGRPKKATAAKDATTAPSP